MRGARWKGNGSRLWIAYHAFRNADFSLQATGCSFPDLFHHIQRRLIDDRQADLPQAGLGVGLKITADRFQENSRGTVLGKAEDAGGDGGKSERGQTKLAGLEAQFDAIEGLEVISIDRLEQLLRQAGFQQVVTLRDRFFQPAIVGRK